MSSKQDRQGVRTAAQVEQKYNFDKRFAEVMGVATDARDSVDKVESQLRNEILEQVTSLTRDTEAIIMTALESYVKEDDLGELKATLESEFKLMAESIVMSFEATIQGQIADTNGDVQSIQESLEKHFEFSANGLTIKAGENDMKLRLDNGVIYFYKGEINEDNIEANLFGWWDGVDFHTGNIIVDVDERAQLGNFAAIPRSNGNLSWLKVKG